MSKELVKISVCIGTRLDNAVIHARHINKEQQHNQHVIDETQEPEERFRQHIHWTDQVYARNEDAHNQLGYKQLAQSAHFSQLGKHVSNEHRHV
jgi:hypothetical protein